MSDRVRDNLCNIWYSNLALLLTADSDSTLHECEEDNVQPEAYSEDDVFTSPRTQLEGESPTTCPPSRTYGPRLRHRWPLIRNIEANFFIAVQPISQA